MKDKSLTQAAEQLKVIAHPARLKILFLLASQGAMNVTAIQEHVTLEQSLLSHHLIKLKDKGVLICQRKGKQMHYRVSDSLLETLPMLSGLIRSELVMG